MSSKNLSKAQLQFSELSLKNNSTSVNGSAANHPSRSASPRTFYMKSPEIHDLLRFRNAVMMKYVQTHDDHFKNMAMALTPQIEDKIREFNQANGIRN